MGRSRRTSVKEDPEAGQAGAQRQLGNWLRSAGEPFMPGLRETSRGWPPYHAEVEATQATSGSTRCSAQRPYRRRRLGYATFSSRVLRRPLAICAVSWAAPSPGSSKRSPTSSTQSSLSGPDEPVDDWIKRHTGVDPSNLLDDPEVKRDRAGATIPRARRSWQAVEDSLEGAGYTPTAWPPRLARKDARRPGAEGRHERPRCDLSQGAGGQPAVAGARRGDGGAEGRLFGARHGARQAARGAGAVGSINGGLSAASHRASFAGALHDGPEAR